MKPSCCWLLAVVLTAQGACTTEPSVPAAAPPVLVGEKPQELLDGPSMRVNDLRHEETTVAALLRQSGRPDSIARGAVECGGELETATSQPGDFWYYPDARYEVNGRRAILASFDVSTGRFRGQAGRLQLNQHTTLDDVRRLFPETMQEVDAAADGKPVQYVGLQWGFRGQATEGNLVLEFANGHLLRVEFWYPC